MPKDYQISQYDEPITVDGWIEIDGARIGIERAHLEEDTGKTAPRRWRRSHPRRRLLARRLQPRRRPAMEIVSRPDIRSAEQARATSRSCARAAGHRRVRREDRRRLDARRRQRVGAPGRHHRVRHKVEIKNMNSLRSLGRAIDYEIERQSSALEAGERIVQETRHWNEDDGRTHSMRTKEGSSDYRYFPEPDLVPVAPTDEMRAHVRGGDARAARRAPRPARRRVGDHRERRPRPRRRSRPRRLRRSGRSRRSTTGHAKGRRELVHRRRARLPQRDRPVARGAPARARRLAELVDLVADGTLSRNQAQGRARRVPARAEAPEAGRRGARARAGERRGRARRRRRRA